MAAAKDPNYFPSLHGFRAIAALTVLFTHVERYKQIAGAPTIWGGAFNSFVGSLAVTFFFVLSGFLITALLLREKIDTGSIRIKKFLEKRMLRIWPLYYTVLIIGYLLSIFVLKDTSPNLWSNGLILNLFLLPNLAFALNRLPEILIQLWTIGTEEQFYFLWPFLVRTLRVKMLVSVFIAIIFGWLAVRLLVTRVYGSNSLLNVLLYRTRIDCMAIGGLAACLLVCKDRLRGGIARLYALILHPLTGLLAGVSFAGLLWISGHNNISLYQGYSLLFALVLLRVIHKPLPLLEAAPFKYAGKISYGIYLLHHFWVVFVFRVWPGGMEGTPAGDLAAFGVVSVLTILSATLSYEFFEKKWLTRLSPY